MAMQENIVVGLRPNSPNRTTKLPIAAHFLIYASPIAKRLREGPCTANSSMLVTEVPQAA
jgi:hypothetical protein